MPAHQLRRLPVVLVFLLVVFLGVHGLPSPGSPAPPPLAPFTTYDDSICSESFMCGGVNISYPFYLSSLITKTSYTSSYYCGYTDLEISCQDETPAIRLGGENYTVLNISYDSHTVVLADSDVVSGESCTVGHNVSFSEMWLHTTSSNANLTFVFVCDDSVPEFYSEHQIDCNGVKSPFSGAAFVFKPEDQTDEKVFAKIYNCRGVVSVPVNSSFLKMMASNPAINFTSAGYRDVLKHGFELDWSYTPMDNKCYPCEQSGGRCAYTNESAFLSCLCHDGKVGNPTCKNISADIAPAAAPTPSSKSF